MELLLEISDNDKSKKELYGIRRAARAVILDEDGKIFLQYVSKYGYYKLPGGGIEVGEMEQQALKREILEEVGIEIDIDKEIGMTIEYRNEIDILQFSYAYLARKTGGSGIPSYERSEIEEGYESLKVSFDEAISLVSNSKTENYFSNFIIARDLSILRKAEQVINNQQ
ncbi:MAG: NUDIX hydrolase [Candidatus Pacebacteria bacterium]|nr:NUDIX hydrolase [Candidatus Paceibacterota bacterium]